MNKKVATVLFVSLTIILMLLYAALITQKLHFLIAAVLIGVGVVIAIFMMVMDSERHKNKSQIIEMNESIYKDKRHLRLLLIIFVVGLLAFQLFKFFDLVNNLALTEKVWVIPAILFIISLIGKYFDKSKVLLGLPFIVQLTVMAVMLNNYSEIFDSHPRLLLLTGALFGLHIFTMLTVYNVDKSNKSTI